MVSLFDTFDLNALEDEDGNGGFDINEFPLETGNEFDLNLPLDEYGAVHFDFVQNLAEHVIEASVQVNQRRKDMTEEVTTQVYQALLARSKNGKLDKKDTRIVADHFGLHIRSVQRLWKRGIHRVLSTQSKQNFSNT
ncbi:uncharacterized protein [Miscanthus floridulus]|uniref:uncharacterized protein isoform X2 n=1 Tax=Miscanthus floridulus TaxID=154761 RepID=UPI00345A6442